MGLLLVSYLEHFPLPLQSSWPLRADLKVGMDMEWLCGHPQVVGELPSSAKIEQRWDLSRLRVLAQGEHPGSITGSGAFVIKHCQAGNIGNKEV